MRRILKVSVVFCILTLTFPVIVGANPVGGLSYNIAREQLSFSLSAGVGFGQRDMHVIEDDKVQDELNSSMFLTKINVAPVRYVDFYGLVGAGDIQLDDGNRSVGEYKGTLNTLYGFGIRPMLFPLVWKSDLFISLDAQYLTMMSEDNNITAHFHEAQASLIVAYVLHSLAPYGGVKYDWAKVQFEGSENDMQGDIEFAIFVGCDYFVTPNIFFNVDLTIFSETRIYAGVGYKY